MQPVTQRIISPVNGDCLRCCVASLLEIDYDDVPNFIEYGRSKWYEQFWKFLNSKGFDLHGVSSHQATKPDIHSFEGVDGYIITAGPSLRYKESTHAVIYKDGKLAHDPHPSRDGIPEVLHFYMIVKKTNK